MRFTDEEYARARQANENSDDLRSAEAELARLRAEVEKLRADVVWAVEEGVFLTPDMLGGVLSHSLEIDEDGEMCAVSVRLRDGTDASLLSAVRRAREERK